MARPISLMIEGWMPSVGSSSSSSFGRITSARPIASCCCWPPERSPPRRPSMVLQHRKQREHVVGNVAVVALAAAQSRSRRFSSTVSSGKISRPCGTIGDAAPRALIGLQACDVLAVEQDRAAGDRLLADDGAQQAGLADAVAAEHAGDLAGLGHQRDAAQRLRRAVVETDVVDVRASSIAPDRLR